MPIRTVEQVMVAIDDFPVVHEEDIVAEAVQIMRHFFHLSEGTWYGFQAALVLNCQEQLVGLLTLRGLLRAFQLRSIQEHLLNNDATGLIFLRKFNDNLEIVVRDIMRPINRATLRRQSSIFEAVQTMAKKKINLLPVMDGGQLAGMVRSIDLFWMVGELLD